MGQQQLLLLVLSTVIVGLATVAGIQAFQQNKSQAANDALTQKATSIASDVQAQAAKPAQLGGFDLTSSSLPSKDKVANSIGFEDAQDIKASGAGTGAACDIATNSGNVEITCAGGNATSSVTATVKSDGNDSDSQPDISTSFGTATT